VAMITLSTILYAIMIGYMINKVKHVQDESKVVFQCEICIVIIR
jgi:hypothetical protein